MAVLIEGISVVVPVDVLEEKYPGGLDAYANDCPNQTFCCDGELTRVGFMTPVDVGAFINALEQKGLEPFGDNCWNDVAVVDQQSTRTTAPCAWLSSGRKFDGPAFACMNDQKDGPIEIHVPLEWKFEGSLSQQPNFVPSEEMKDRVQFLRSEGMNDVYLDLETGEEKFVGRVSRPSTEALMAVGLYPFDRKESGN